jgi:glycogenin glucosyltransferase
MFSRKTTLIKTYFKIVGLLVIFFIFFVKIFLTDNLSEERGQIQKKLKASSPISNKNYYNLLKSCLNEVKFEHDISVWTFLTDDSNYAHSAVKLLKSIEKNAGSTKFDKLIIELSEKPLSNQLREMLMKVGWNICVVKRIEPRDEANTFPRFRDQFTKLILFNMTEYKSVVYFDSDVFVINNIEPLLNVYKQLDNQNTKIACTRDIRASVWQDTFNMGVFSIRPDHEEFKRLIEMKSDANVKFETAMSEQGFLNVVYKNKWLEFGFEYNANLAVFSQQKAFWNKYEKNISVIHYTMNKPWSCSDEYIQVCKKWIEFL